MRVLCIDIETSPNVAYTWGLFNQNIGINQIIDTSRVLCFSAKWLGEENQFAAEWIDRELMLQKAWDLLNEADAVIHYYGSKFDVPHLNREFLMAGFGPPSPYKQIDLKVAVAKTFKFTSNKLQHVSEALGLAGKIKTDFSLWEGCLNNDPASQAEMEEYNRQDVELLEELYHQMLPWIPQLPNRNLYDAFSGCPYCAGEDVVRDGFTYTALSRYKRFHCNDCGAWLRAPKRENGVQLQPAV
jgi:DNA polymerase elongation subunit (family B)